LIKEQEEIDFDNVMEEEKKRKEEARLQAIKDEQIAKMIMEEELKR
jgi:hypothetical protein